MKKLMIMGALFLFVGAAPSFAQSTTSKVTHGVKKGATKAAQGVKKGGKKVGEETAELASKGKSKISDKEAGAWKGPEGQTVYIDNSGRYYYINSKGNHVFATKSQLRAKY
jgi:hypothetical protein